MIVTERLIKLDITASSLVPKSILTADTYSASLLSCLLLLPSKDQTMQNEV